MTAGQGVNPPDTVREIQANHVCQNTGVRRQWKRRVRRWYWDIGATSSAADHRGTAAHHGDTRTSTGTCAIPGSVVPALPGVCRMTRQPRWAAVIIAVVLVTATLVGCSGTAMHPAKSNLRMRKPRVYDRRPPTTSSSIRQRLRQDVQLAIPGMHQSDAGRRVRRCHPRGAQRLHRQTRGHHRESRRTGTGCSNCDRSVRRLLHSAISLGTAEVDTHRRTLEI